MRLAVALVLCGALLVGCGGEPEEESIDEVMQKLVDEAEQSQSFEIFGVDNCSAESGGYFVFEGKIRNESDYEQDFLINVEAINGPLGAEGIRLGDASTVVSDLAPGRTALWDVVGNLGDGIGTAFHCQVTSVE